MKKLMFILIFVLPLPSCLGDDPKLTPTPTASVTVTPIPTVTPTPSSTP